MTCIKDERVAPDLLGSIVFLCIIPKNPMLRCFLPEVSLALLKRVTIILIIRPSLLLGFPGWWEEETAAYQSSTEWMGELIVIRDKAHFLTDFWGRRLLDVGVFSPSDKYETKAGFDNTFMHLVIRRNLLLPQMAYEKKCPVYRSKSHIASVLLFLEKKITWSK